MLYSERMLHTPSSFIRDILKVTQSPDIISFAGGLPNPISFPIEALRESANHAIEEGGSRLFQYSTTEGHLPLREYIVAKYKRNFGLEFDTEDVLITTGSQQALDLIGKTLLNRHDGVIIEEPGYLGAIQAFSLYEPHFFPVTLNEDGLNLQELESALQERNVKLLYTVPNFQNPTGITYSAEKRFAICDLLSRYEAALIEDDPYGELRFHGTPLPYIGAGKLPNSILLGTFSKTVTPGMRLGFIITKNRELMKHLVTAKQASDLHTNIFSQYVIHDYLVNNAYADHVKNIIALYREQAFAMVDAMQKYFPPNVSYTKPDGGMFLWVTLPQGSSALELFPKALEKNVAFVPGDPFYTAKTNVNTLRLNFTNSTPEAITEGIKRLGTLLQ